MTAPKEQAKPFKKISDKEYEIQINGRTKAIMVPFAVTELIFKSFISNGGVIDPNTGEVQTDLITLIGAFKEVGNILLSEYDEDGKLLKEGNCAILSQDEVISLFQLATEIIAVFIGSLSRISPQTQTQETADVSENEKSPETTP